MNIDKQRFLESLEYRCQVLQTIKGSILRLDNNYYTRNYLFKPNGKTWEIHKLNDIGTETTVIFNTRIRKVAWKQFINLKRQEVEPRQFLILYDYNGMKNSLYT